jgi:hypothetical protein
MLPDTATPPPLLQQQLWQPVHDRRSLFTCGSIFFTDRYLQFFFTRNRLFYFRHFFFCQASLLM